MVRLLLALSLSVSTSFASFRADLCARSLAFFREEAHPSTGLVRDRARADGETPDSPPYRMASLAGTGFGLAVLAEAARSGQLKREVAQEQIERTLRFVWTGLENYRGWLYHFVDWETGRRFGSSEISTIDTALFLAGALYAGQIFPDSEISHLADQLYRRVDFPDMLTDGGTRPDKLTLSMGWMPETGYLAAQWDSYAEHMILLLLGMGHPEKPLPAEAWTGPRGMELSQTLPLFVHQYSHLFINFQNDAGMRVFFDNSVRATLANKNASEQAAGRYTTYAAGFWGLSASGSADGYQAFSPVHHDGTVCLGCAGASYPFHPEVLNEMQNWAEGSWSNKIWSKYGFVDSVNLDKNWFDPDVLSITVGPLYLALNDISSRFTLLPAIQKGLERASKKQ